MVVLNAEVFDELISGTGNTWWSSEALNRGLGEPHGLVVFATAWDVSGSSPVVKVFLERSSDNQHWYYDPLAPIISSSISNGSVATGQKSGAGHRFRRFRVILEGTSPKCRLRLHVTGRRP